MSDHLTKDAQQKTIFWLRDSCITIEKDAKLYILEHLDHIKLSRSQYIAFSVIS